jgi:hypothetical protein
MLDAPYLSFVSGVCRWLLGIQLRPLTSLPVQEMCTTCPFQAGCVAAAHGDTATTSNHRSRKRAGTGDVRYVSFVSGVRGGGSWGYSYNL